MLRHNLSKDWLSPTMRPLIIQSGLFLSHMQLSSDQGEVTKKSNVRKELTLAKFCPMQFRAPNENGK